MSTGGRDKGLIGMSMNFEVNMAAPLDARFLVKKKEDLTLPNTFGRFWYKGMLVTVTDDIMENNGVYRLNVALPSLVSSWVKEGTGSTNNNVSGSSHNGNIRVGNEELPVYVHPEGTNPHGLTPADLNLDRVNNTSDEEKPLSRFAIEEFSKYQPREEGKGLSEENFTTELKAWILNGNDPMLKGAFVGMDPLLEAYPEPKVGEYAFVLIGTTMYFVMVKDDGTWFTADVGNSDMSPAEVRLLYESNPDRNAFTDDFKHRVENTTGINTGDETNVSIKYKLGKADVEKDGYLSAEDWQKFNNKQPSGEYLTEVSLEDVKRHEKALDLEIEQVNGLMGLLSDSLSGGDTPGGYILYQCGGANLSEAGDYWHLKCGTANIEADLNEEEE